MTREATQMMEEALKVAKLDGSFFPAHIGARIGLDKVHAAYAARALANEGVIDLGFDSAAHFTRDFRIARERAKPSKSATRKIKPAKARGVKAKGLLK